MKIKVIPRAHEVAERKRMEYEAELNLQKIDNMKADEQMEALKEFDEKFVSFYLPWILSAYYKTVPDLSDRNCSYPVFFYGFKAILRIFISSMNAYLSMKP